MFLQHQAQLKQVWVIYSNRLDLDCQSFLTTEKHKMFHTYGLILEQISQNSFIIYVILD